MFALSHLRPVQCLCLCLLLCALPGRAGDTTPAVSIIEVIANPAKYDGKQIKVFGYVELGPEASAIYLHKEDCDHSLETNGVALRYHSVPDYKADPKGFEKRLGEKYDLIDGTFVANKQFYNPWSGTIINITRFSVWSDPSTPTPAALSRKAAPASGAVSGRVAQKLPVAALGARRLSRK